jgi:oligosaccharide reducing-end xylanase
MLSFVHFGARSHSAWLTALTLGLVTVGCSSDDEPDLGSAGGNAGIGGSAATAGRHASGGASAMGGSAGGGARGGSGGSGGSAGGGSGGSGGTSGGGSTEERAACTAPAAYRNLFVEILGKTQAEVDTKLGAAVQQLFHGTGDQPIYYEFDADEAYVTDIANNDIRSEGQSYGMLVAVMLDMKPEFDKLWKFAATRMRQSTGLFAWQLNTDGTVKSKYAAPDGEEYFAMALMLASRHWGDGTGTNYGSEAKAVMNAMVNAGDFNKNPAVVTFGPGNNFSDASYVLPLFYSEWACFDTANATFWNSATTYARTFFQKATNSTTGLAPERSGFDGSPQGDYGPDAWRVPMNIMMDYNLNNADPWQATYAARMAAFWTKEGLASYGNGYTLSGSKTADGHGQGQTSVNAMLAFGLPAEDAKPFLQAAWDAATPTGMYRYYDGCLYLLSMLHMTGKFNLFY